jgi:signal transduction histidine kinase
MVPGKDMEHENSLAELGSAAAGIAHDINNQLTLILNYLEIKNVEGARAAAGRCSALTSSLLSWCRGETMRLQSIDTRAFLVDFANSLHVPDTISLTLEAPASLPAIKADPVALSRILTNLVTNACYAMNNAGAISIRAFDRTIEITDSGPGIAPEIMKRVFEPFFSTKGSKGTGLGLAIVREIMREHGGNVVLRNEPGRGATFSLRFR